MAARNRTSTPRKARVAPVSPQPPEPEKTKPTRWRLDLSAGLLLLGGFAVALALFSHDPADPPAATAWPVNAEVNNLLGPAGAWLADALLAALGLAVHALLVAWFVLVLLLLSRRGVLRWGLRLLGWLLLLPGLAGLADLMSCAGWEFLHWTPPAGPGGSLGAWLTLTTEASLQPWGQMLVLGGLLALGLTLAGDFLLIPLLRGLAWSLRALPRLLAQLRHDPQPANASSAQPGPVILSFAPANQAEETEEETPPEPPAVRDIPINHHDRPITPASPPRPVIRRAELVPAYAAPTLELLQDAEPFPHEAHDQVLRERAALLEKTFADFGMKVQVVGINTGPVITQFEIALDVGLRVGKVTSLADDIALNLRVPSVRMVAPIPGKNTVGVEIPNEHRAVVRLKEVLLAGGPAVEKLKIPLFLGKDAEGRPLIQDLADMPHLLIAGRTGTGKSVCMNAIILSVLMTRRPEQVRMIMVDPKMTEFNEYGKVPHLLNPVVTDMKKAEAVLAWAVDKMEERYDLFRRARVRGITAYNELSHDEILRRIKPEDEERQRIPPKMPYIVIFIDEMADLILLMRKEVEGHIIRLAQKSRAAGIHLVVATQKPTVDVITGLIKSNLPARICFKVASKSDSRVVLDAMGADKLLGKGDMLYMPPGSPNLIRAQCTYASDDEITRVVSRVEVDEPAWAEDLREFLVSSRSGSDLMASLKERDPLYEAAIEIVIREQRGSVSLLQRAMGIGYGRAARLIDFMAEDGIVGAYNGSNAREVLYKREQWEQMKQAAVASQS